MTEYTPGPWGLFDGTDIWPINADGGGYIARLRFRGEAVETATGDREFPETEANARLIAAAPDLMEAAKAALSVCEDAFTASNLHYEIREEEGGEGYLCVFCECFSSEGDRHTDDCPATEELSWKVAVALRAAIAKAEGVE